jgi:Tol biopolymer transport system component
MFLTPIRICLRAGLMAGVVVVLGPNLIPGAAAQDSAPANKPGRAHIDEVMKGLNRGRSMGQVAVSPDGKRLAWLQYGKDGAEIRVAPLDDLAKSERVTAAAKADQHCREGQFVWAPDAKTLAFFSDCGKPGDQTDLYVAPANGGPARRLTELKGYVEAPAFAPDGQSVAFLYVEGATRSAGALAAMKPPSGVIGEDGVEIQRVAVASVNTAKPAPPSWATPANLHAYEFDWRPDSKGLAYVAADPPGENNWWVAKLYTQELSGTAKAILTPEEVSGPLHGLQIAVPRWSPDGKAIAFIGGLMSDQGSTGGDVWIVPADGGQPVDLTPQRPSSPAWIEW